MGFELRTVPPEEMGIRPRSWDRVLVAAAELCQRREFPAFSLQIQRHGLTTGTHHFGSTRLSEHVPVTDDTLYLVASLTKPMIALAVLLLVERGQLSLNQRVVEFIPAFREAPKRPITVRHLLAHTSGLPDMLPANAEMRRSQAPLSKFVEETCRTELVFPPGRSAQYQSMGYALLGPLLDAVTGQSHQQFVRRELFEPLGMQNSWLGLPEEMLHDSRIAEIRVPPSQHGGDDWNWNSPYWRRLGAPWGGVICTIPDLGRFCRCWLSGGLDARAEQFISPELIREATTNRLGDFTAIPEADRRTRGWGLGWRMNWKEHRSTFCDLLPGDVFGHWGATGTLFWIDPHTELGVVMASTAPLKDEVSPLTRLSNMIAAAVMK